MSQVVSVRQWTPKQVRYQEHLATPPEDRATVEEILAELGVSYSTLRNWRDLPGWDIAVRALVHKAFAAAVPDVLNIIKRKALHGEQWAIDRFLTLMGAGAVVHGDTASQVTMTESEAQRILVRARIIPDHVTTDGVTADGAIEGSVRNEPDS